ncbi:MAG: hypothetical protein OEW21_11350 [Betaproteobacteria bacterium]|nr:hypothetical protein [Betaproteobacteria bacterium]
MLELVRGFAVHMYMARQEVEQTRAILDDAATHLMPVFMVCRQGIGGEERHAEEGSFAAQLASVTRTALPAMQFHDISSQLLAHIRERFDTFLAELESLSRGLGDGFEGVDEGELARKLAGMRTALASNLAALDRRLRKPVDQANMASGEIELF